jgi:putative membrane protein
MKGRARRWALPWTAAALVVAAAGACQNSGDHRDEAPAQGGTAPGSVDRNPGAVTSASGAVNAGPNAPNNDKDTTALPGMAGSGTAGIGRPSGSVGQPGAGPLHTGDPSDESVRQVIAAIHQGEVEAAQLAVGKAQNAQVKAYAQNMLRVHQGPARGAPAPGAGAASQASDLLVPLQEYNTKTVAALRTAPGGPAFDRAYITSQVASHASALQTLGRLETAAKDDALTDQIRALKGEVQRHQEDARRLQAAIGGGT